MDVRKVVINFLAFLLFLFYFFTITSKFLKYETVTNVDVLAKRKELPPIDSFLGANISPIYKGSNLTRDLEERPKNDYWVNVSMSKEEILNSFTMNGRNVNVSNDPFMFSGVKFWKIEYETSKELEDEVFEINTNLSLENSLVINRVLSGRGKLEISNTLVAFIKYPKLNVILAMVVLRLLSSPYDTDCVTHNVSQVYCIDSCMKPFISSLPRNVTELSDEMKVVAHDCYIKCEKKDCLTILFDFFLSKNRSKQGFWSSIFDGKQIISIKSAALFGLFLFIQQTFGLIAIFFEFVVLDLIDPLVEFLKWSSGLMVKKRRIFHTRQEESEQIFRWKKLREVFIMLVLCGSVIHFSFIMSHYFEYRTSMEAFFGNPTIQHIPNITICFAHNVSSYNGTNGMTFEQVESTTPTFEETFNVSFPFQSVNSSGDRNVTLKPRTVFKSSQKCFFVSPPEGSDSTLDEIIVTITSLKYKPIDATFSLNGDIGHQYPQLEANETNGQYATQVFVYNSLPAPFRTNCIKYNDLGYGSRLDCHNRCIVKQFVRKYNSFPAGIVNEDNFNLTGSQFQPDEDMVSSCLSQCYNRDCHELEMDVERSMTKMKGRLPTIHLLRQKYLTSISVDPEQSVSEFVAFIANLFSFWIGSCRILASKTIKAYKMKRTTLIKSVICSILLIGFLFHMYELLSHYFSYEMVSSVSMGFPVKITLPFISIVLRLNNRTSRNGTVPKNISLETLSPLDLSEKFIEVEEMVEKITIIDPDTFKLKNVTESVLENLTHEYIFSNRKIITFDLANLNGNEYIWFEVKGRRKVFFSMNFIENLGYKYEKRNNISIHNSSFASAILHSNSYYNVKGNELLYSYTLAVLQSRLLKMKLLPHPFPTDCVKYSDPLKSKDSWFNCIIKKHRKKYGTIPNNLSVPASFNNSRGDPDMKLIEQCIKKYNSKPVCESVEYRMTQLFRGGLTKMGDVFVLPSSEETRCEFIPKMPFLNLTIYLAEILDIWLGINVYFLLTKFSNINHCTE